MVERGNTIITRSVARELFHGAKFGDAGGGLKPGEYDFDANLVYAIDLEGRFHGTLKPSEFVGGLVFALIERGKIPHDTSVQEVVDLSFEFGRIYEEYMGERG